MIGLAQDEYAVTASGISTETLADVTVGLNQEVSVQIVLTRPVGKVTGTVVTQLIAGQQTPVENATVTVTGVTRYVGLTPVRESDSATTPVQGTFTICTDGACAEAINSPASTMVLPLVQERVDVTVTAPGFQPFSAVDVSTDDLQTITLSPAGVSFYGSLAFDPALAGTALEDAVRNVRFSVQSAPPGVGQLSLTAVVVNGTTPTVVWSDSAQGTDPLGPSGSRLVRPGTYTVTATLPGYDLAPMTFTVSPGVAMPRPPAPDPLVFTLRKFGFLRVSVATTQDPTVLVPGAIVTVTLASGVTQQRAAHPGDTFVDFGDLPTGQYTVDVRAPGHARVTTQVQLNAGDRPEQPKTVTVRRLGLVQGVVRSVLTTGLEQDLPGAQVSVRQGVGGTPFVGTTGSSGAYLITGTTVTDGLVTGTWLVGATAPGHDAVAPTSVFVPDPLTAPLDQLDVDVDPILLPAQNGELRVRAYDGPTVVAGLTMQLSFLDSTGPRTISPTLPADQQHRSLPRRAVRVHQRPAAVLQPEHLRGHVLAAQPAGDDRAGRGHVHQRADDDAVGLDPGPGPAPGSGRRHGAGARRGRHAHPRDGHRADRDVRRQRPVRVPVRPRGHLHAVHHGRRRRRHPQRRRPARAGDRRRPAGPGGHAPGPGHGDLRPTARTSRVRWSA